MGAHGVTVNAIAPGVFETDLNRELLKSGRGQEFLMRTPMGRFGRVDELVGAAVFLASDAASFVTGQLIAVDGGFLASGVNNAGISDQGSGSGTGISDREPRRPDQDA